MVFHGRVVSSGVEQPYTCREGGTALAKLGMLLTPHEQVELEYILRKELEDLLADLEDRRLEGLLRNVLEERYALLLRLYSRVAPPREVRRFLRSL